MICSEWSKLRAERLLGGLNGSRGGEAVDKKTEIKGFEVANLFRANRQTALLEKKRIAARVNDFETGTHGI